MRARLAIVLMAVVCMSPELTAAQGVIALSLLKLESDPPGAYLKLGKADSVLHAHADTMLAAGSYRLEASLTGYQPLVHQFNIDSGDTLSLRFVLLADKPIRPTPEQLGLEYKFVMPLLLEEKAQTVRRKYNTMAEVFLIIPLAQGIMAAIALGGGEDYFSAGLMATGVGLSAGSYLLGKLMGSRKLKEIRRQNQILAGQNLEAERHNGEVETQIRRVHAESMREWQAETSWRGRVEVLGR
jgi:hypothetical protein